EHIVGIEICENVAAGALEALIDGVALPLVALRLPEKARAIPAKDRRGLIGRAAIDDEVFDMRIILAQHAVDGALEKGALVERRRHDRHERRHGGILSGGEA